MTQFVIMFVWREPCECQCNRRYDRHNFSVLSPAPRLQCSCHIDLGNWWIDTCALSNDVGWVIVFQTALGSRSKEILVAKHIGKVHALTVARERGLALTVDLSSCRAARCRRGS